MNNKNISGLLDDTIAHWERMIAWVKKQPQNKFVSYSLMLSRLKEAWMGADCPLCKAFHTTKAFTHPCGNCPLNIGVSCSKGVWNKYEKTS